MANLIVVTSFTKLAYTAVDGKTASPITINVKNILYAQTLATPYLTTGITRIVYELQYNQMKYQIPLIVTEAVAAIVTAANT